MKKEQLIETIKEKVLANNGEIEYSALAWDMNKLATYNHMATEDGNYTFWTDDEDEEHEFTPWDDYKKSDLEHLLIGINQELEKGGADA